MKRIAASQLALLKFAKTCGKKGFTVDDAVASFKSPRQSTAVRLDEAIEKGWLTHKWEPSAGGAPRSRFTIAAPGLKVLKVKWVGRGRFRQAA
jgi:hypothetical protein